MSKSKTSGFDNIRKRGAQHRTAESATADSRYKDGKEQITVRLDPQLHKDLKLRAVADGRNKTEIITQLLEDYLY